MTDQKMGGFKHEQPMSEPQGDKKSETLSEVGMAAQTGDVGTFHDALIKEGRPPSRGELVLFADAYARTSLEDHGINMSEGYES